MNISLYQAATALEGAQQRQNVIAENLAASGIPGFKRNTVGYHSVNAAMFNDAMQAVDKTQLQYMLPRITGHIDFSQGALVRTGDNTNLAVDGPGFFAINGPDGVVYTRDGSFHVSGHDDSKGQLVTKEGYPLRQAGSGAPIIVATDTDAPITVSRDGMVSQGGAPLGQIELRNFTDNDLKLLKRANSGYYQANGATPVPVVPKETKVAQGFLEGSNTTPMHEMSELRSSLRHFEANQKIMKIQDEQMGRMIRELGTTQQ
jgi:flagellar basal body rod protein FlgG